MGVLSEQTHCNEVKNSFSEEYTEKKKEKCKAHTHAQKAHLLQIVLPPHVPIYVTWKLKVGCQEIKMVWQGKVLLCLESSSSCPQLLKDFLQNTVTFIG